MPMLRGAYRVVVLGTCYQLTTEPRLETGRKTGRGVAVQEEVLTRWCCDNEDPRLQHSFFRNYGSGNQEINREDTLAVEAMVRVPPCASVYLFDR